MPTKPPEPTRAATGLCLRQCPTTAGDYRPLIAHTIGVDLCLVRQRDMYHKCYRCAYRGKSAGFIYPDGPSLTPDS